MYGKSEEEQIIEQGIQLDEDGYIYSYPNIPYFVLEEEVGETRLTKFKNDFAEIMKYYKVYEKGSTFFPEGSNGDYIPSKLRYKKSRMIMNKEARFCFANPPTFNVNVDDVDEKYKNENAILQDYLDKVLEKTKFHSKLLKGLKDCFIGKRIAIVLNFNKDGIGITFLNSLEFIYEFNNNRDELVKFISFYETTGTDSLIDQRWFKKMYVKKEDGVYLKEEMWSGDGDLIETILPEQKIKFDVIPVMVILNDGLTGDIWGESELAGLWDSERYYSKLANSDMDSERKNMHPIRYTIDAADTSTNNLSTSPGSYWDLQTDVDKPYDNMTGAKVGVIEASMNYSTPLKTTLDRIENQMYAELDVPNITSEQLAGVITSGKTIQALYWGLTVRCDEKMLAWSPNLTQLGYLIIEGGILYPECIKRYTDENRLPVIPYDVIVENNYPIPEDVKEEKELDIAEVESQLMSRKFYMKKWRKLNDQQSENELKQIQLEKELLENSFMDYDSSEVVDTGDLSDLEKDTGDNNNSNTEVVINQRKQVDNSSKVSENG